MTKVISKKEIVTIKEEIMNNSDIFNLIRNAVNMNENRDCLERFKSCDYDDYNDNKKATPVNYIDKLLCEG